MNGAIRASEVLSFAPPAKGSTQFVFTKIGSFIGPSVNSGGMFRTSIGHPYSLALGSPPNCYISNQDTNTVSLVQASTDGKVGTLTPGCQSQYLVKNVAPADAFLDGTIIGSQTGALPAVDPKKDPKDVPQKYGGLAVGFAPNGDKKVQHSVRDIAAFGGVLLVCDEPDKLLRLYQLSDGSYLGSSAILPAAPTHLSIFHGWLYVSAGDQLYATALAPSPRPSDLCFIALLPALTAGDKTTIGGTTLDAVNNVMYVVSQLGTGGQGTGAIWSFDYGAGSPPSLNNKSVLDSGFEDTPEFVLYLPSP